MVLGCREDNCLLIGRNHIAQKQQQNSCKEKYLQLFREQNSKITKTHQTSELVFIDYSMTQDLTEMHH